MLGVLAKSIVSETKPPNSHPALPLASSVALGKLFNLYDGLIYKMGIIKHLPY